MATSYEGILENVGAWLRQDTSLTTLLALRTVGGVADRKFSIFSGYMEGPILAPCVAIREISMAPGEGTLHDSPMSLVALAIEVSVFGAATALRAIQAELDERFENAVNGQAPISDGNGWTITDIDTAGQWNVIRLPQGVTLDGGGQYPEQRAKVFTVTAGLLG